MRANTEKNFLDSKLLMSFMLLFMFVLTKWAYNGYAEVYQL